MKNLRRIDNFVLSFWYGFICGSSRFSAEAARIGRRHFYDYAEKHNIEIPVNIVNNITIMTLSIF